MPLPMRLFFSYMPPKDGHWNGELMLPQVAGETMRFVRGSKSAPQAKPIPRVHKSLDQIIRLRVRVKRRRSDTQSHCAPPTSHPEGRLDMIMSGSYTSIECR